MKKHHTLLLLLCLAVSCNTQPPKENQPLYLGQPLPGNEPELFAPGIVNTGMPTRDITFSPDGKEVFVGVNIGNFSYSTILHCKYENGALSTPEVAFFAKDPNYSFLEPYFSPVGEKLFFVTNKGNTFTEASKFETDIWVTEKVNGKWNMPTKLDTTINSTSPEFFPSVAKNGNLYFTRETESEGECIFKSEFKDGKYQPAVKLPDEVNAGAGRFNATIAPDESFIIVPALGLKETFGSVDYYISFYDENKGWSNLLNMGGKINSHSRFEYSASFSPDGKYVFFMSARTDPSTKKKLTFPELKKMHNTPENGNSNIYWMKAGFIDELKTKAIYN